MSKKSIVVAAMLLAAICMNAQNKSAGINLSLWKGASTQPLDSVQTTYFNLGFVSAMNQLKGVGVNVFSGMTIHNMYGVQISGLANIAGGSMHGLQLAGLCNVNGDSMTGLSASGLMNIVGDTSRGMLISGLGNISGDNTKGVVVGGILNITGDEAKGLYLSGMANIAGGSMSGILASGLLSVAGDNMNGLQLSGLCNVVGDEARGVQVSLFNYATNVRGLQIGLVNYYHDELKGFQLGLINANPNTRIQYMLFGGTATKLNFGVRFKNRLFYTILGAGTHYLDFDDKFSASFFYRAGMWRTLYKGLSISGDLGYQHIETFKNKSEFTPRRLYALQGRVNLEYSFSKKFGIFASGGYGKSFDYKKSKAFDDGIIGEIGIVLN